MYTIGHRDNYQKFIDEHGEIMKGIGGYVFATINEAVAEINRVGQQQKWAVWKLKGDYETTQRVINDDGIEVLAEAVTIISFVGMVDDITKSEAE